jgi:hypothetical protein
MVLLILVIINTVRKPEYDKRSTVTLFLNLCRRYQSMLITTLELNGTLSINILIIGDLELGIVAFVHREHTAVLVARKMS